MNKVLILGAGASYGHGVEGESKPPTANGFFDGPIYDEVTVDCRPVLHYLESGLRIDLRNTDESDTESVLAWVEPAWKTRLYEYQDSRTLPRHFPWGFFCVAPVAMFLSFIFGVIHISTSGSEAGPVLFTMR